MHDGTTPLILAARLAVDGMVEELINCHADANATDDSGNSCFITSSSTQSMKILVVWAVMLINPLSPSPSGKSALHWAAAVNNVEAAMVLLKNGANKDMQDNKVCEKMWFDETEGFGKYLCYILISRPKGLTSFVCLFLHCRRRHHFSLQPVKAAMRQPRFSWNTLPTVRSLTILTSYPEISPRNACTTTSSAFWTSTTWLGVLGFTAAR